MHQLLIIAFLFCVGVCRGQSPILPINDANYPEATGAYYKDLNNDLNRYVGTWKYTNGTTTLTVTLQKAVMQHIINAPYDYYEDLIIGEYKYILNGVEKINTLPLLTSITNPQANSIKSFIAVTTGDIRLYAGFIEAGRDIPGMDQEMIFRRADVGSTQKIKLVFRMTEGYYTVDGQEPQYTSYTLPFGEYILTKQP